MVGKSLPQSHILALENVLDMPQWACTTPSSLPAVECASAEELPPLVAHAGFHFPFLGKVRTSKPPTEKACSLHPCERNRKFGNGQDISTDSLTPTVREGACLRRAQWGNKRCKALARNHVDVRGVQYLLMFVACRPEKAELSERLAAVEKLHGCEKLEEIQTGLKAGWGPEKWLSGEECFPRKHEALSSNPQYS